MLKLLKKKIKIKKISRNDVRFLYNIYNENIEKGNFFSKKKLNYLDHKIWFNQKKSNSLIFICIKKVKIGYIRYDEYKKDNYKVSIAIKDSSKNKGVGKLLLKKTLKKINSKKFNVFAYIKRSNDISKKFFLSCNFKMVESGKYMLKVKK